MAFFVSDCPRCKTKRITFEVKGVNHLKNKVKQHPNTANEVSNHEIYGVCYECKKTTIFIFKTFDSNMVLDTHFILTSEHKVSGKKKYWTS